ncbi:hypothetical protein NKG94_11950 [Micromonospora sp. M12]
MAGQDEGFALGVDVGTSNTVAVLRWPDGRTRPLLMDGQPLSPSAVYADPDGTLHTGWDARRLAQSDPARFEANPKRRWTSRPSCSANGRTRRPTCSPRCWRRSGGPRWALWVSCPGRAHLPGRLGRATAAGARRRAAAGGLAAGGRAHPRRADTAGHPAAAGAGGRRPLLRRCCTVRCRSARRSRCSTSVAGRSTSRCCATRARTLG